MQRAGFGSGRAITRCLHRASRECPVGQWGRRLLVRVARQGRGREAVVAGHETWVLVLCVVFHRSATSAVEKGCCMRKSHARRNAPNPHVRPMRSTPGRLGEVKRKFSFFWLLHGGAALEETALVEAGKPNIAIFWLTYGNAPRRFCWWLLGRDPRWALLRTPRSLYWL